MKNLVSAFRQVGPAIIVAAVVLGPGSITTSTKVGAAFGYEMLWLLLVLLVLLVGVASLAAWLGATLEKPLCRELSDRLGPWAGWVIGIAFFLIVAGFQSSNNTSVIAGLEPLVGGEFSNLAIILSLLVLNGLIIGLLWKAQNLYKQVENIMKVFILIVILAFLANFFWAKPSVTGAFKGLMPNPAPFRESEHLLLIMGMIGTTFSVAGAFYQGYLVREKGWGPDEVKKGFRDSLFGMSVLVGVTAVIMMTAAATFHGSVGPGELGDAGAMSSQLQNTFGPAALWIFCLGFLAGALSSFLVNAMIGGHVFADGSGAGSKLNSQASLIWTTIALLVGMIVGILTLTAGFDRTAIIIIAQASTVVGGPAVVAGLLFLGVQRYRTGPTRPPLWMLILTGIGLALSIAVAISTTLKIIDKIRALSDAPA